MYRVRAAATFSVSLLFASLLFIPHVFAQTASSGGDADDAANKTCQTPTTYQGYNSSLEYGAHYTEGNVTKMNLYKKPCEEMQGSVRVKGYCVAASKCKATCYYSPDGKDCKPVSEIEKQIDQQTQQDTTQKTGEQVTREVQDDNFKNPPQKANEQIDNSVWDKGGEDLTKGPYSLTNNPVSSLTTGERFNQFLSNITGNDFTTGFGDFNTFDGSVLSSWEQNTFSPAQSGGFESVGNVGGETGFSGGTESTGFNQPGLNEPSFSNSSNFGGQPSTFPTEPVAPVQFTDNPWTMPQAPSFETPQQVPLPGFDSNSPLPNAFNDQTAFATPNFNAPANTNWAGTNAPVAFSDYINTGGKSIADAGLGVGGAIQQFANPDQGTQPITTPTDLATVKSPTAVEFTVGKTIEDTVPVLALQGGWANEGSNFGRLSSDISWVNGNRSDIAGEYSYALEPGIVHGFWPTPAQLATGPDGPLAGADQAFDVGQSPESVGVGSAPNDQVTGLKDGETIELSGKPRIQTEQTFNVTAYFPCGSAQACSMQGGPASAQPGLDGESKVRTLDDYRLGKSEYVTGASDKSRFGETYEIPSITYKSPIDGKSYTLEDVPVYVHDTGSAFQDRPDKLDIAVGTANSDAQAAQLAKGQPFLADRYQTYANVTGTDLSARADGGSVPLPQSRPEIAEVTTRTSAPEILSSGPSVESIRDVNFAGLSTLKAVETGAPLPDITPIENRIPTASWIPQGPLSGEQVTADIRNSLDQEAINAITEAPTNDALRYDVVKNDVIDAARSAETPDVSVPQETPIAQEEPRVASAPVQTPESPTVRLGYGLLTLDTAEIKSAWSDIFRGSGAAEPLEGYPTAPVERGTDLAEPLPTTAVARGDLAPAESIIVPEGQSAVLTPASFNQNRGLSGGFANELSSPTVVSESEFSRFVAQSKAPDEGNLSPGTDRSAVSGTISANPGETDWNYPTSGSGAQTAQENVPLPQSRPEIAVHDVPLPTDRPTNIPLEGTGRVPEVLAGADERQQVRENVPLPQERPLNAPLAGTGRVPEILASSDERTQAPTPVEQMATPPVQRLANPDAQPWNSIAENSGNPFDAGGQKAVTLTCTGGGGVCGPDQRITAAGTPPPEGQWIAVPRDNPQGIKIGDKVDVQVGGTVIKDVPVADYTRTGGSAYVASGALEKDLGGSGKDAAIVSLPRAVPPPPLEPNLPAPTWTPPFEANYPDSQRENPYAGTAALESGYPDSQRENQFANTTPIESGYPESQRENQFANTAQDLAIESPAGEQALRLDVMRAADLNGSYMLGETSIRATKDGITYTDAQGAETYVPREQLGDQSVADIVGDSKASGPLVQNTPASVAEIEQKYLQEVTTAQPPAEEKSWLGQRFDSFKEYFSPTEQKSDDQPKQQYASRTVCDACIPGTWEPEPAKNTSQDSSADVLKLNNTTPPATKDPFEKPVWYDPKPRETYSGNGSTASLNNSKGGVISDAPPIGGEAKNAPVKVASLDTNNIPLPSNGRAPEPGGLLQQQAAQQQQVTAPSPQTASNPAQISQPIVQAAPVTQAPNQTTQAVSQPSAGFSGSTGNAPTQSQFTNSPFSQTSAPQYNTTQSQSPFSGTGNQFSQPQFVNTIAPVNTGVQNPIGTGNIVQNQIQVQSGQATQVSPQNATAPTQPLSLAEQLQQRLDAAKAEQNTLNKIKAFLTTPSAPQQQATEVTTQSQGNSSVTITPSFIDISTQSSTTTSAEPTRVIPSYTLPAGSVVEITGVVPKNASEIILNLSGVTIIADESGIALRDQLRQSGERVIGALVAVQTADMLASMNGTTPVRITVYPRLKGTFTRAVEFGQGDTIQNIVNAGMTKTYQPIPQTPVSPLPVWGPNQIWTLQPTK